MGLKSVKSIKNVNDLKKDKKKKDTFGEFNLGKTLYIVISLVLTIVLFIGMLYLRDRLSDKITYDEVAVVTKNCPEGEVITKKNVDTYFAVKKVPSESNFSGTYTNIDDLVDSKAKVDLEVGEIVGNKDFTNVNEYTDDIVNPVLTSLEVSGLSNAAGGSLRQGDIINISIISNTSNNSSAGSTVGSSSVVSAGENATVFKRVYVANAKDSSGAEIAATDKETSATVFSVILSQDDSTALNDALNTGSLIRVEKVLGDTSKDK